MKDRRVVSVYQLQMEEQQEQHKWENATAFQVFETYWSFLIERKKSIRNLF